MKKRRFIKCISFISAVMLCLSMIMSSFHPKIEAQASQSLSNGTYTIKGFLKSATSEQASMGNAGIVQPMQLLVKDGKYTIRMECKALSTKLGSVNFKGYLAQMGYFPEWDKESQPNNELAQPIKVESYYKDVYDQYNDPKKGTDSTVKGKLYPHYLNLPVDYEKKQIWIQVYVPVMEEISKGSGLQYARLQLDWTTVKKVSDEVIDTDNTDNTKTVDKGGLQYLILSANALLSHESLYTKATINTLKKSLQNAKAVYNNTDATQAQVNQQMKALSTAITGLKEKKTSTSNTTAANKTLNIKKLDDGIYSVSGRFSVTCGLMTSRPFRSPHHTISDVALVGGGTNPQPGEISLAHNGVLFLDELPEFMRSALEVMRQPLEERRITISRAKISVDFPANFMLIASMNPCPCGFYNHPTKQCVCQSGAVQKYLNKISGPLLDRIDIHIQVTPVSYESISAKKSEERSADIQKRVENARKIQLKRFEDYALDGVYTNSMMTENMVAKFCVVSENGNKMLKNAMEKLGLSARAYSKILKVARTIADLYEEENIKEEHIAEAIRYRSLDRSSWGN